MVLQRGIDLWSLHKKAHTACLHRHLGLQVFRDRCGLPKAIRICGKGQELGLLLEPLFPRLASMHNGFVGSPDPVCFLKAGQRRGLVLLTLPGGI